MIRTVFSIAAFVFAGSAQAEVAYVTDMLQLDMYSTVDMTGPSIRKLRSGDKLELLERNGRTARVRSEGTEGWVKSLYLVEAEPARSRVNQLERSNQTLEGTVSNLRAQLEAEQGKLNELAQSQSGGAEKLAASQAELDKISKDNQRLINRLDNYAGSVPLNWLLIAVVISLLGGGAASWYFIDKRSRDRHGGYRVY